MTVAVDTLRDKLTASLKRHNPSRVRAYAGDDDFRDIAVPTRRRRWSVVVEAIDARAWTRIELLDKSGAVLGYVENVEPARELEEIGGGRASKLRSESEWIVSLVVKAQRDAMTFRDAEVTSLMRCYGDTLREMSSAMRELSAIHREQREASVEVAKLQTIAAAGPERGQVGELLDALPTLLQALPLLRGLLSPGVTESTPPAKLKNGA